MKKIEVRSAGITDRGKQRSENQDHFLVAQLNRGMKVISGAGRFDADARLWGSPVSHIFVVADGMGGYEGGEIASRLAVDEVRDFVARNRRDPGATWPCGEDKKRAFAESLLHALKGFARWARRFTKPLRDAHHD